MKLIELTKICTKCGERKPIDSFYKKEKCRFGVMSSCKVCVYKQVRKWREDNPEKMLEINRNWNKNNCEKIKKKSRKWYKNNSEKACEKSRKYRKENSDKVNAANRKWVKENPGKKQESDREYYENNTEKVNKTNKKWQENNPEKVIQYKLKWQKNNRDKVKIYENRYKKKRRKNDSKFHLRCKMSSSVAKSLKNGKGGKSWLELVPYTLEQLKKHLEKQFQPGMSWKNYGEWHMDHRTPLAAHNFTKPEHTDFKRAWALSNLRPMWAKENMLKGAKLTKPFQPSLLI